MFAFSVAHEASALHLQVAAHGEKRPDGSNNQTEYQHDQINLNIRACGQIDRQPHKGVCNLGKRESMDKLDGADSQGRADNGMHHAFHKEGPANEAVRSADETHDGNLLAAGKDGEADGVVDEDQRDEDQQGDQRYADVADVARQAEETVYAVFAVFDAIRRIFRVVADSDEILIRRQIGGDGLNLLRIRKLDFD